MKYDRSLIEAIYIIQQKDEALAEKMWNRLAIPTLNKSDFYVSPNMKISYDIVSYLQSNGMGNKVQCIKMLRQKTGIGLKEALDAVVAMKNQGVLHYE